MTLQIGIVGLPNVGKSTLFNALTSGHAAVANYPFTTIDPNVGIAEMSDHRLHEVAAIVQPKRVVPAVIEFVDIAGLVQGASRGEGLGNQFLGHIRNVDAIAMVLRCFRNENIPHQFPVVDPLRDVETIDVELILADVGTIDRRLEKAHAAAKANPREHVPYIHFLEKLREHLDGGNRAINVDMSGTESEWLKELDLLSGKPQLYILNIDEEDGPDGGVSAADLLSHARKTGTPTISLCAKLEAELAQLPPAEAAVFREEMGLGLSGLDRLAAAGYRLLDLITFFTATGTEEVRGWPLQRGKTVWEAAGMIHTDMQRGFIRAEVIPWDLFVSAGSWSRAREGGQVRVEGRDYILQDGDVVHIRFHV